MIVTNAGWDAVDVAASGAQRRRRAVYPVSDHPARRRTALFAYGKTVWSWHPLLMLNRRRFFRARPGEQDLQSADDGDKNELVAGESTA
jgi:hypothetical protein